MDTNHEPNRAAREVVRKYQSALGFPDVGNFVGSSWPFWDRTLGCLLYIDGEPRLMTSCVMDVFKAAHRRDVRNLPDLDDIDWDYYAINEETLPRAVTSGRFTVVFLGERNEPYPLLPIESEDVAVLSLGAETLDIFLAGVEAIKSAHSRMVMIRDDGFVLNEFPNTSKSFGFADTLTECTPKSWFEPLAPGPPEMGYSAIVSHTGEEHCARWVRMRIGDYNAYWVRPWVDEPTGAVPVGVTEDAR